MKDYNPIQPKIEYQMPTGTEVPDHDVPPREVLQNYELRFRTMEENITMGMFRVTPGAGSRVISANRVLAQMLGYDRPEELCGKPTRDLLIQSADLGDLAGDIR